MLVAEGLSLGLSQNEVNDGLDEFPVFPIHHLPGIVLSARLFRYDKGSDQMAICTKWCSYSTGPNLGLFTGFFEVVTTGAKNVCSENALF